MPLTQEQRDEIQQEVSRVLEMLRSNWVAAGPPGTFERAPSKLATFVETMMSRGSAEELAHSAAVQIAPLEPLVRVIARAVEVLGASEKALRWINAPVRSLDNQTPSSLLGSSEGITRVEDALGRIEHGVW